MRVNAAPNSSSSEQNTNSPPVESPDAINSLLWQLSDTKERNQLLASADLQGLQGNLREIAEDSEAFEGLINTAFGDNIAADKIDSLRRDVIDGTLVLPNVRLVDTNTLAGATGAFEAATNTIYLDERLAGTAEGRAALSEEFGHALDVRLNGDNDAPGDEGAIFNRLLDGESLNAATLKQLRLENDSGSIMIDGRLARVEFQQSGSDRIEEILDDGGDFDVSEGDLDEIHNLLEGMTPTQRNTALSGFSDRQLDVLFHNVHSSGFWSNDWNTNERHDFYQVIGSANDQTLARIAEFSPLSHEHLQVYQGAAGVEGNYPINWTNTDIIRWQAGDTQHLFDEKSRFIEGNRDIFDAAAEQYDIPPLLLAGVAFNEFGGDPLWIDTVAQKVREFDHSGPDWVDENLTVTGDPDATSHGNMSIQVRTAAETLGYDPDNLSDQQRDLVIRSLQDPTVSIFVAANHLSDLRDIDNQGVGAEQLTNQQISEIATRYNRGGSLSLEAIRSNTDYGDDLLGHTAEINAALAGEFEAGE